MDRLASPLHFKCTWMVYLVAVIGACAESQSGPADGGLSSPSAAADLSSFDLAPRLALTTVTPEVGSNRGGLSLLLDGDDFASGAKVSVGGVLAADAVVVDSKRIALTLPARPGGLGRVPIVVSLPDGRSISRSDLFSYSAGVIDFDGPRAHILGAYCSVVAGDFDRDGRADIAAAFPAEKTVKVFQNDGTGWFKDGIETSGIPLQTACPAATSGDFNNDGTPDLAITSFDSSDYYKPGSVIILLGNGAGGFSRPFGNYPVGDQPASILAADWNGDGNLDLATLEPYYGQVSVILGDGTGAFAPPWIGKSVGYDVSSFAVGDLNEDGQLDLVLPSWNGIIYMLPGEKAGTFGAAITLATGPSGLNPGIQLVDFDGDRHLDIAYLKDSHVCVLLNRGGSFSTAIAACFDEAAYASSLIAADMNADGAPDVVLGGDGTLQVLINQDDGTGTFLVGEAGPGGKLLPSLWADFNNDGIVDIAFAGRATTSVGIQFGNAKGLPGLVIPSVTGSLTSLVGEDLNGDGRVDLTGNTSNSNWLYTVRNGPGGRISSINVLDAGGILETTGVADLNQDSIPDLIVGTTSAGHEQVSVLLGSGGGRFAAPQGFPVGSGIRSMEIGLLNDDPFLDVAVVAATNEAIAVLLGNGKGGFAPAKLFFTAVSPRAVAAADLNHDGSSDLVVSHDEQSRIEVLWGNKQANFSVPSVLETGLPKAVDWLTVSDLDGNGLPDIIAVDGKASQVAILLNQWDRTFQTKIVPFNPPQNSALPRILVADLNGDLRPELILRGGSNDPVCIAVNNGAGGFDRLLHFTLGSFVMDMAVADWDADGKPDLISSGLVIFHNQSW